MILRSIASCDSYYISNKLRFFKYPPSIIYLLFWKLVMKVLDFHFSIKRLILLVNKVCTNNFKNLNLELLHNNRGNDYNYFYVERNEMYDKHTVLVIAINYYTAFPPVLLLFPIIIDVKSREIKLDEIIVIIRCLSIL